MDALIVWRTPTTDVYGDPGSNRWVRAYTIDGAREQCFKSFGVWPVQAWPAPGNRVQVWEKAGKVRNRS